MISSDALVFALKPLKVAHGARASFVGLVRRAQRQRS
jgi:hypothetical protein